MVEIGRTVMAKSKMRLIKIPACVSAIVSMHVPGSAFTQICDIGEHSQRNVTKKAAKKADMRPINE